MEPLGEEAASVEAQELPPVAHESQLEVAALIRCL